VNVSVEINGTLTVVRRWQRWTLDRVAQRHDQRPSNAIVQRDTENIVRMISAASAYRTVQRTP
jgi:hypothetical protein